MRNRTGGFTIVELIIVILVIAILAAIAMVAYANISDKTYNTRIISGVKSYQSLLEAYKASAGSYPKTTREKDGYLISVVCLGGNYEEGFCGKASGVDIYIDPTFNESLEKIGSWSGIIHDQSLPSGPAAFTEAVYGNDILDPSLNNGHDYGRTIQYALYGSNVDCGISGAYAYRLTESPPVTACEIVLETLPRP